MSVSESPPVDQNQPGPTPAPRRLSGGGQQPRPATRLSPRRRGPQRRRGPAPHEQVHVRLRLQHHLLPDEETGPLGVLLGPPLLQPDLGAAAAPGRWPPASTQGNRRQRLAAKQPGLRLGAGSGSLKGQRPFFSPVFSLES